MLIIADSGSTKTTWLLSQKGRNHVSIRTEGLNPNFTSTKLFRKIVSDNILAATGNIKDIEIFFYGAGCSGTESVEMVSSALKEIFPSSTCEVGSDLLGAARGLFGDKKGIACILGTGSNSGLYNGNILSSNIPPLGFILGDEGSGSYMGKRLLSDYLKGIMPSEISELFTEKYHTDRNDVISNVYRGEFPGKYIASFVRFIRENISHPYFSSMVEDAFSIFIERNIRFYKDYDKQQISFTGSVAWHFRDQLIEVLNKHELNFGETIQDPAERILEFHLKK